MAFLLFLSHLLLISINMKQLEGWPWWWFSSRTNYLHKHKNPLDKLCAKLVDKSPSAGLRTHAALEWLIKRANKILWFFFPCPTHTQKHLTDKQDHIDWITERPWYKFLIRMMIWLIYTQSEMFLASVAHSQYHKNPIKTLTQRHILRDNKRSPQHTFDLLISIMFWKSALVLSHWYVKPSILNILMIVDIL